MAVITISRQFGSGGNEVAKQVCEVLEYQYFDKRLIADAAEEAGISQAEMVDYSEESHQVRGFLDRLFNRSATVAQMRVWKEDPGGIRSVERVAVSEEVAVGLVQKALQRACLAGKMVIVGRGGQVVLRDCPHVLNVRIEAPFEDRIQRIRESLKQSKQDFSAVIDLRRQAQDLIEERDAASADYLRRFYQVDWDDPLLYHVVLNLGRLNITQAVEVITNLAGKV
jgi:cytidylate kinase